MDYHHSQGCEEFLLDIWYIVHPFTESQHYSGKRRLAKIACHHPLAFE